MLRIDRAARLDYQRGLPIVEVTMDIRELDKFSLVEGTFQVIGDEIS